MSARLRGVELTGVITDNSKDETESRQVEVQVWQEDADPTMATITIEGMDNLSPSQAKKLARALLAAAKNAHEFLEEGNSRKGKDIYARARREHRERKAARKQARISPE